MHKYTFILVLLLCRSAHSQMNPHQFLGSWFGSTGYGMTFYRIKHNGIVVHYSNGCTNSGKRRVGNWTRKGDSLHINFTQDTIVFRILNNQLTNTDWNKDDTCTLCGYEKILRATVVGAKSKWRREQRRKKRDRYNKLITMHEMSVF